MKINKKNKISLIVTNYNGKVHLKECFESIFEQTLLPDEIFLYDNDSTDGGPELVKKLFPQVKIIQVNGYNTGTARGSNIAFTYTEGDYIIYMSNDIRADKNCIKELIKPMKKDNKIGVSTCVLLNYFADKKTGEHYIDNAGGLVDIFGFAMQNYPGKKIEDIPEQGEVFFSYGGAFAIRRNIFKKIGGFDERFFMLVDDLDYSWRTRILGYKVIYNKKSYIYHKISATLRKFRDRPLMHYWSEKNYMRSVLKNCTLSHLIWMFPLYLLLLFGQMAFLLYKKQYRLFLSDFKSVAWNFIHIPDILWERYKQKKFTRKNNINKLFVKTSFKLQLFHAFSKAL
jgi:hypothetical protein